jgi:hypothetical protein
MSRSGLSYDGDYDNWSTICWQGALASAKRGKKGQAFLKELLAALDAMPVKRLIRNDLVVDGSMPLYKDHDVIVGADELVARDGTVRGMGEVCALGALGMVRGLDMSEIDPEDHVSVAALFEVNEKIVQDIVDTNDRMLDFHWVDGKRDEDGKWIDGYKVPITPEERWQKMRDWIAEQIWDWKEID